MDCSPPGFSVHGIFQARVLEWAAIAFSEILKYRCFLKLRELISPHSKSKSIEERVKKPGDLY